MQKLKKQIIKKAYIIEDNNKLDKSYIKLTELFKILDSQQLSICGVVSSLTAKDKLYLNTLLVNKLLEKDPDGTYKAVKEIGIFKKVNDLMEKVNNS